MSVWGECGTVPGMEDGIWKCVEFCWAVSISGEGKGGERRALRRRGLSKLNPLRSTALK